MFWDWVFNGILQKLISEKNFFSSTLFLKLGNLSLSKKNNKFLKSSGFLSIKIFPFLFWALLLELIYMAKTEFGCLLNIDNLVFIISPLLNSIWIVFSFSSFIILLILLILLSVLFLWLKNNFLSSSFFCLFCLLNFCLKSSKSLIWFLVESLSLINPFLYE